MQQISCMDANDRLIQEIQTNSHAAPYKNNTKIIKNLLANGADPNYEDERGFTPLGIGADVIWPETIKLLYSYGADINKFTTDYYCSIPCTPLYAAAMVGSKSVLKCLIALGADINKIHVNSGVTPLSVAAKYGYTDIVKYLLKIGANIHIKDRFGNTALDWAHKYKHAYVFQLLLKATQLSQDGCNRKMR